MKRLMVLIGVLALTLAACGGGSDDAASSGDATAGQEHFVATCAACHGQDATGIEGLGKDLHGNAFVASLTDEEVVDFLEEGRGADHPDNDTGVAMPPKGGNPSLSEEDLLDITAYLRTLD